MLGYAQYYAGGPLHGVAAGEWYRLITSAFLPGTGSLGILDIAFNMWALYVVGPSLEQLLGKVRFLAVYLLSAVGGSVLFYYLAPQNVPALGAIRRHLRPVRRLVRGLKEAGLRQPRDRAADRAQPRAELRLPQHDRVAGPRGRANRGCCGDGRLRVRAAQEPHRDPGRGHRRDRGAARDRGSDQDRSAHRRSGGYRHLVASTTPATISTNPQTRFHPPSDESPGMLACVT